MAKSSCASPSWLAAPLALVLTLQLAACGGSDPAGAAVDTRPTAAEPGRTLASVPAQTPQAAAAGAATAGLPIDVVLDWAELRYAALFQPRTPTLSRSGPASFALSHLGSDYTVRAYPAERYLGVTTDGAIYGLGDFTGGQLTGFGRLEDYTALVLGDARPQTVSVMLSSDVAAAESFRFSLGAASAAVTAQGVAVALGDPLVSGSTYTVNQTEGPRSCTLSANRNGTVGFRDIVVTADCGHPAGQSRLAGQWHAPVGAQVVLQLNGGQDLSLTMPGYGGAADPYNLLPFSFDTALGNGAPYAVSVKSASAGLACSVYKGSNGTMPVALGAVRVGCEWRDDLVSRSTDSSARGSYFNSRDLAIGGAAVPIGRTTDGYGEGRFVAFVSLAAGIGGASGSHRQVFWRDRMTGETLLVSAHVSGAEGNGDSFAPALSADGLTVAFESYASNLVGGDSNGMRDVFVWSAIDRSAGVQRVSVGPGGAESNSESFEPTISGDGQRVAFTTSASNLTPGVDDRSIVNVVLRDRSTGTNVLVSADRSGKGVGGSRPALSEDGGRLAFYSFSSALVDGDMNGLWDIFVYDVGSAALRRISLTTGGGERNAGSESVSRVVAPAISGNGRYVAFATTASNMVGSDTNGLQDVFVVDLDSGAVQMASAGVGGAAGNGDSPVGQGERVALSYDGRWVAYTTAATNLGVQAGQVVLRNLDSGQTRAIGPAGGSSNFVVLSRLATTVGFGHSAATDPRFGGSGLFVEHTDLGRSWWWFD
jgi:Tol biopolymer transport system component